jgi:hypothetical protein
MNLHELNGQQLDRAYESVGFLLSLKDHLDPALAIKLDTLRADLTAEREDRRRIARH